MSDLVPHHNFRYVAISGNVLVRGEAIVLGPYATRDQLDEMCLNGAARIACKEGRPWNPFNVELALTHTK